MQNNNSKRLLIGKINGLFGVCGWIKLFSYTDPKEKIVSYKTWLLKLDDNFLKIKIVGRKQGKTVIAKINGIDTPEQAKKYLGKEIYINTTQLAILKNEYYYYQLEGLRVINNNYENLGTVAYLFNTGSNTILVTKGERERLIPFIKPYLINVNLAKKLIIIDWDKDF